MRVLLIAPYAPWPADSGGAQRSLAVARALSTHHEVVLSCALPPQAVGVDRERAKAHAEHALSDCVREVIWAPERPAHVEAEERPSRSLLRRVWSTVRDRLLTPIPYAYRERYDEWAQLIGERQSEFGAVVVRCVIMAPVAAGVSPSRVVLDADDLNYAVLEQQAAFETGARRLATRLEARRSWRYERTVFAPMAQVLVSNEDDRARLAMRNASIIANGVSLAPAPMVERQDRVVVFVGHCGWRPNGNGLRWFLDNAWPRVLAAVPDAELNIVGREAHPSMIEAARYDRVAFRPDVPEVASWFASAAVSVVPLLEGSGTRIKIIESIGYGTPTVSTPVGASGLQRDFDTADGLYLAEQAPHLADALVAILRDGREARANAACGARRVAEHWSWEARTRDLPAMLAAWVAAG